MISLGTDIDRDLKKAIEKIPTGSQAKTIEKASIIMKKYQSYFAGQSQSRVILEQASTITNQPTKEQDISGIFFI